MNNHRRAKSACEISIDLCRNIFENAKFSIQVIGKLPGNIYQNGIKDNVMLEYQLQREDFYMKILCIVDP